MSLRMHAWVEAIGELYHRNAQRLAVWDEALPLAEQSSSFQAQHGGTVLYKFTLQINEI